jgi:hypothetical protein
VNLLRVVLIALAGGVIGRWLAGFVLGVVEPLLLGVGLVDPVPGSWAGSFPVLAGGFLPSWLLGSCGGAALTTQALFAGWLTRRRVRRGLALIATLAGAGSLQILLRSLSQPSWLLWSSALGLGLAAAILGGVAAKAWQPQVEVLGGRRRVWTLVALATLCLGLPTQLEAWERHSPKDYPANVVEFVIEEDFPWTSASAKTGGSVRVESDQLLLVRQPSPGQVEIHLSWRKAGELLELTRQNVGEPLSVRVNGKELTRPVIRSPIPGGKLVIAHGTAREGSTLFKQLTGASQ